MLERLAAIRRAIAGEVTSTEGIDQVRAALGRLFEGFVLHPRQGARFEGTGRAELLDIGDLMIELVVNPDALLAYDSDPVLRREPLGYAENNSRIGLPIR